MLTCPVMSLKTSSEDYANLSSDEPEDLERLLLALSVLHHQRRPLLHQLSPDGGRLVSGSSCGHTARDTRLVLTHKGSWEAFTPQDAHLSHPHSVIRTAQLHYNARVLTRAYDSDPSNKG